MTQPPGRKDRLIKKAAQAGAGIGAPLAVLSAAGIPGLSTIGAATGLAALGQISGLVLLGLNPITAGVGALLLVGGGSAWLAGNLPLLKSKGVNGQDEHDSMGPQEKVKLRSSRF